MDQAIIFAEGQKPKIRIFRPGEFTSAEGQRISFSQADIDAIISAYDAEAEPAPLVVGHPKMDDPAWGWVSGLVSEGGVMVAEADQVVPSFAEDVRAGRYRKVSASFYPPDHPNNPRPGQYYLKHVGFLGAHAPGVRGLGTVSLAEGDEDDLISISIHSHEEPKMSDKKTEQDAREASFAAREASFAEREAALAEREDALKKDKAASAKAASDARHADHVSFAEGLVSEAKLAPAGKILLIGVLDKLGGHEAVSFGEAGEMSPAAALKKLLADATPLISLGESGKTTRGAPQVASFAAPAGYDIDAEHAALHGRAKALQADNPKLNWMDAVRQAQAA